jgi:hypothetical protein
MDRSYQRTPGPSGDRARPAIVKVASGAVQDERVFGPEREADAHVSEETVLADGIDLLRSGHRRLEVLLRDLGGDCGSSSANIYGARRSADALVAALSEHLDAEARYLHPLLGAVSYDGEAFSELETAEARQTEAVMRALSQADPTDSRFTSAAAHLRGWVVRHITRQERHIFPKLRAIAGPRRSALLQQQPEQMPSRRRTDAPPEMAGQR